MCRKNNIEVYSYLCFLFLFVCTFNIYAQVGEAYVVSDSFDSDGPSSFQAFELSEDEAYVVFRADPDGDGQSSLYSVSTSGGELVQLSQKMIEGGEVGFVQISSNSQWVVYLADREVDGKFELYSVPIQGGEVIKLSNGGVQSVRKFQISPNNDRVVYYQSIDAGAPGLFSVPISGGDSELLNSPTILSSSYMDFEITPNGQRVIYLDDQDNALGLEELYSVPIAGGASIKISPDFANPTFQSVSKFQISPDSEYVVFQGTLFKEDQVGLFSARVDGVGGVPSLTSVIVDGGHTKKFQISSDSSRVVYTASINEPDVFNLFSVDIFPTEYPSEPLNPELGDEGEISSFTITPDGINVIYGADLSGNEQYGLYRVPIAGGLNTPLTPIYEETNGYTPRPIISPDGNYLIYAVGEENTQVNLYQVPTLGGMPTKLNSDFALGGLVLFGAISNDSSKVIYLSDSLGDGRNELFSVSILGGTVTRLNLPYSGSYFGGYGARFSSNDNYVVFDAPLEDGSGVEIFVQKMNGDEDLCFPIKAANNKIAVICL